MDQELKDSAAEKFGELTLGFSQEEGAVRIFNFIRDIPYYIDPEHFDLDTCQEAMLRSGRGSCFPKHYVLGSMLRELGYEAGYSVYTFHWKDQNFTMPGEVRLRADSLPVTYHMACKILTGEKWITVDATWPQWLSSEAFPVNEDWHAEKTTKLAVDAIAEFSFDTAREVFSFVKKKFEVYTLGERLELSRFTIDFNRWMASVG